MGAANVTIFAAHLSQMFSTLNSRHPLLASLFPTDVAAWSADLVAFQQRSGDDDDDAVFVIAFLQDFLQHFAHEHATDLQWVISAPRAGMHSTSDHDQTALVNLTLHLTVSSSAPSAASAAALSWLSNEIVSFGSERLNSLPELWRDRKGQFQVTAPSGWLHIEQREVLALSVVMQLDLRLDSAPTSVIPLLPITSALAVSAVPVFASFVPSLGWPIFRTGGSVRVLYNADDASRARPWCKLLCFVIQFELPGADLPSTAARFPGSTVGAWEDRWTGSAAALAASLAAVGSQLAVSNSPIAPTTLRLDVVGCTGKTDSIRWSEALGGATTIACVNSIVLPWILQAAAEAESCILQSLSLACPCAIAVVLQPSGPESFALQVQVGSAGWTRFVPSQRDDTTMVGDLRATASIDAQRFSWPIVSATSISCMLRGAEPPSADAVQLQVQLAGASAALSTVYSPTDTMMMAVATGDLQLSGTIQMGVVASTSLVLALQFSMLLLTDIHEEGAAVCAGADCLFTAQLDFSQLASADTKSSFHTSLAPAVRFRASPGPPSIYYAAVNWLRTLLSLSQPSSALRFAVPPLRTPMSSLLASVAQEAYVIAYARVFSYAELWHGPLFVSAPLLADSFAVPGNSPFMINLSIDQTQDEPMARPQGAKREANWEPCNITVIDTSSLASVCAAWTAAFARCAFPFPFVRCVVADPLSDESTIYGRLQLEEFPAGVFQSLSVHPVPAYDLQSWLVSWSSALPPPSVDPDPAPSTWSASLLFSRSFATWRDFAADLMLADSFSSLWRPTDAAPTIPTLRAIEALPVRFADIPGMDSDIAPFYPAETTAISMRNLSLHLRAVTAALVNSTLSSRDDSVLLSLTGSAVTAVTVDAALHTSLGGLGNLPPPAGRSLAFRTQLNDTDAGIDTVLPPSGGTFSGRLYYQLRGLGSIPPQSRECELVFSFVGGSTYRDAFLVQIPAQVALLPSPCAENVGAMLNVATWSGIGSSRNGATLNYTSVLLGNESTVLPPQQQLILAFRTTIVSNGSAALVPQALLVQESTMDAFNPASMELPMGAAVLLDQTIRIDWAANISTGAVNGTIGLIGVGSTQITDDSASTGGSLLWTFKQPLQTFVSSYRSLNDVRFFNQCVLQISDHTLLAANALTLGVTTSTLHDVSMHVSWNRSTTVQTIQELQALPRLLANGSVEFSSSDTAGAAATALDAAATLSIATLYSGLQLIEAAVLEVAAMPESQAPLPFLSQYSATVALASLHDIVSAGRDAFAGLELQHLSLQDACGMLIAVANGQLQTCLSVLSDVDLCLQLSWNFNTTDTAAFFFEFLNCNVAATNPSSHAVTCTSRPVAASNMNARTSYTSTRMEQ